MSRGEPPQRGTPLDDERHQGVLCLARRALVTVKFRTDVCNQDTRSQLSRIEDLNAQHRVLVGTSMNRRMLGADLLPASQITATNIHERGVLMEEARQSVHVMLIPRMGEACDQFSCDIGLVHVRACLLVNRRRSRRLAPQGFEVRA